MIIIYLSLAFTLGMLSMGWVTMRMIENRIEEADLCADDKKMIRDVLGIIKPRKES